MYSRVTAAFKFIQYWLGSSNGKGHGIHSPFVYSFIRDVLMDRKHHPAYDAPEEYRAELLKDHSVLQIRDLGAGSVSGGKKTRTVQSVAQNSIKHKRYSSLLYRICNYFQYKKLLEMGTSLGVTTLYLEGVPGVEQVVTMEGAEEVADKAESAFRKYGHGKVKIVRGDFNDRLEEVLRELDPVDFVFIDGNHRKKPTLDYFDKIVSVVHNNSCIVFDDIHWSREMEEAWDQVSQDPRVTLSIDLHAIGLVFFRKEILEKQHFRIRY